MGTAENEDTAPPALAGATPQDQPIKTQKSGEGCCRFTFMDTVSRVICCSTIQLGPRGAKKGGGSGLENALVCCANVEYDSDVEDNQEIKGGGGGGGGGVDTESVSFCCSRVDLKKQK
ncbi:hypothetical protein PVL29_025275 [Vitis rotundifolia]|uniref:Uncharacterized protein n=1 Tax=Vitis rotundifolia TaxID=103349 RepID=A0AA38YJB9_VITRO|nr:hypothetical protein PVL29_025275 [Vitis rotundifolia]